MKRIGLLKNSIFIGLLELYYTKIAQFNSRLRAFFIFRMGVSSATPNLQDDNTSTIEPNRDGDSSIKTLQQFSNTALATVSMTYY